MRLGGGCPGLPECSGGAETEEGGGAAAVVVVGVKLDCRSRELLTWALVKVAQCGDCVIALHILDPNADKSTLLSLVKNFDSVLAAYEGFCNLKQVDLKLKVCKGSPARKILSREAKSCGATSLIVGTSEVHHTVRSRISVAKYCAKSLPRNVSVMCVNNGKVVFRRESTPSTRLEFRTLNASESRFKRRKILARSPLSLPTEDVLSPSSSGTEGISMAMIPVKTQEFPESKSTWTLLRKVFLHGHQVSEAASPKKAVAHWKFKLPSRQSVAAVYPDQKQISASIRGYCRLTLDEEKGANVPFSDNTNHDACANKIFLEELRGLGEKYSTLCRLFSYQELLFATNNFSPENLIGKGGCSRVYRGCLPGGKEIAVKVLKPSKDALKHFVSEIEIITSFHKKNIISLLGFSYKESQLLLVYNLLPRGCLEENLHSTSETGNVIGWEERYKVALGVAEALDHLHSASEPIIHRDVKSSNILLSDDFEPQLSDFGLAAWASSCSHHMDTSDVVGTFGYLAPEYFMDEKLNEKIDVYAYGVVLLELVSGRKPIDGALPKGQESLVLWAKHIVKEGKLSELRDPNLIGACDDQFEKMVLAATLCIRHLPQSRPEISQVLKLLHGDKDVIEWARQEANNSSEDFDVSSRDQSATNIQSFINLALLNLEDDVTSISSSEHNNISVDDYLSGRWSCSSSFN
ncbi:Protein kinase protein with adenine nucleotide alpha hydrolases-like domain [Striga hermonthica]|uniref:Protein kinase protein with adenine nucleotide alpha hydrolases-like domain n=1 Tax=Striga hermonthica TaxID=68872 RepID=A0A9N7RG27_STRHE|nr:Protein kinase protein with adenine nucleotide alpha hydrolases-like domain [Striga hermonthica]